MFNVNLKEVREEKGLTQQELAQQINVVRQTVSKWERGLSMPDVELLMKIAEVLGCTVDRLLGCGETVDMSQMAIQLAMLNQQFAIKNRREEQIWSVVSLILKIVGGLFIAYIVLMLLLVIGSFAIFSGGTGSTTIATEVIEIYNEEIVFHE